MKVGIEAINIYGGPAIINVEEIFRVRGLDLNRFENLMMKNKSVGLPCEDTVTNGVNAAKAIIDTMEEKEKSRIEMVITSTESGIDFGKSTSTYIHEYLGLTRNCRLFEVKQACYAGTAALQMACHYVAASAMPGSKVLVIATDVAHAALKGTYAEPSQAVGSAAMLISDNPVVMEIDLGAFGCYSYEVMDTCRPNSEIEIGDPDLSLISYMDCVENCFQAYADKVADVHFKETFSYLAFHTPFAGLVKGVHRKLFRRFVEKDGEKIEVDFKNRVLPSLYYGMEIGNTYSASLYVALVSLIENIQANGQERIGLFSYGSGCSSEFYSGVINSDSQVAAAAMNIRSRLQDRYPLSMDEYERLLELNREWMFGVQDKKADPADFKPMYDRFFDGRGLLVLKRIENYHREYEWS